MFWSCVTLFKISQKLESGIVLPNYFYSLTGISNTYTVVSVFYKSGRDRLGVTFQFLLKVMVGGSIKYIAGMVVSLAITIGNIHLIRLDSFSS